MKKKLTRRQFIKQAAKLAVGSACCAASYGKFGAPLCYAQSAEGNGRILVLINLAGGIDGLNWVVPYTNSVYYSRRPDIAVPAAEVLTIDSELGFHPSWQALYDSVWTANDMAVIQQVGYPNADFSHFASQDIWTLGRRAADPQDARGWLGRLADIYFNSSTNVFGIGVEFQNDFLTDREEVRPIVVEGLSDFSFRRNDWMEAENLARDKVISSILSSNNSSAEFTRAAAVSTRKIYQAVPQVDAVRLGYSSSVTYPDNNLGNQLRDVAKVIQGDLGTSVFYTDVGGWDHHSGQLGDFGTRLLGVAEAADAFVSDVKAIGRWNDVCLVFFSEFGRNCYQNDSVGTDHGHGNNLVLMGGRVNSGLYGLAPTTTDLSQEYLDYDIDFRSVLKAVIRDHLGLDPDPVFTEVIAEKDVNLDLFS